MSDPTYHFSDHAQRHRLEPEKVQKATLRAFEIIMQRSLLEKTVSLKPQTRTTWAGRLRPRAKDTDDMAMESLHEELKTLLQATPCYVDMEARQVYEHRNSNYTLLHAAAECGQIETVQLLLNSGSAIDSICAVGSALAIAIQHKDTALAECLLQSGADVEGAGGGAQIRINQKIYRDRPLHQAILNNHLPTIQALLKWASDLNAHNVTGQTPLMMTTVLGSRLEAAQLLLDAGANPNIREGLREENYPIQEALAIGSDTMLSFLLDAGANMRCCVEIDPEAGAALNTRIHNSTDSSLKFSILSARWEDAHQRWEEIVAATRDGSLTPSSVSPHDMVLCANIGTLDALCELPVWQQNRQSMVALLQQVPLWMQKNMIEHHAWIAEACNDRAGSVNESVQWSHKLGSQGVSSVHRG